MSKMDQEEVTHANIIQEREINQAMHQQKRKGEESWRLKSRILWLSVGDKNTTFFHKQYEARLLENKVP